MPTTHHTKLLFALSIGMLGCYNADQHLPTDSGTTNALQLSTSATALPADGFSQARITATLDPRTAPEAREVTFRTTAGAFVGASGDGKEIKQTADLTGTATADLRSAHELLTAHVTAIVSGGTSLSRTIDIQFTTANPADTIRVSVSQPQAPADGATIRQVYADIAPGLPAANRTVTFSTTAGKFVTTNTATTAILADSSNRATADLISSTVPTTARITGAVNGVSAETSLTFVPALPDAIIVDAQKFEIKPTESVTITATLRRILGTTTDGLSVTFTATDPTGTPVGAVRNARPSTNSQATALFSPDGTTYRGLVTIRATATATTVTGETVVKIIDP